MKFVKYNNNPYNRKTGDCVVRAIALALQQDWFYTYTQLLESTLNSGYSIQSRENYERYLKSKGLEKQKQPRKPNNKKYTVKEFADQLAEPNKIYIINIAHHLTVVKDKDLYDTWDCSRKCVGNYWIVEV